MDTIKMIAYRAETAMSSLLRYELVSEQIRHLRKSGFIPQLLRCEITWHEDSRRAVNISGASDRVRTDDLLITSELLYLLSYAGFINRNSERRINTKTAQFVQGYSGVAIKKTDCDFLVICFGVIP